MDHERNSSGALRPASAGRLAVAFLLLFAGCGTEPDGATPQIPDPGIEFVTSSGMQVRMLPDPGSGLFACNVFVGAGSTREDDATAGSSHFLEHLLFNGTQRRSQEELYADADRIGAYNNATTRLEYTHFMMVAPSEEFATALDIQSDMLLHSILPEDKFEKERGIVLEEMSKDEDNPAYLRGRIVTDALYGAESDFARPVLGTRESIATLERQRVLDYYRAQYVPSNMKLLLMGDFDPDAARATIEEKFAAERGSARPAPVFESPSTSVFHVRSVEDDAITLSIQMPAPQVGDEDHAPMALIVDVLGGGESSRLPRALRQEPAIEALEIGASLTHLNGGGLLQVNARLPLDADADEAMRRIFEEMATVATTGLRASEWSEARNRALTATIREIEQLHYYALLQGDRIWHGPAGYERAYSTALQNSYPRIEGVAETWLSSPAMTVVKAGPGLADEDREFDPAARGYVARADAVKPSALPGGGVVRDDRPLADGVQAPSVTVLNNGLTVIHAASPSTRMFAMHLMVKDRSAREPEGLEGIADLLHRVLVQGAGNYDREEFAAALDGIGAQWKVTDSGFIPYDDYYGTDPRFSFIRMDCVDLYWREAVRLMGAMLGSPRLTEDAIDRSREEMKMRVAQDASRPTTIARQLYEQALLGKSHPLTHEVFGTPQSLDAIERRDVQSFQLDYLDPGQLVLAIVGNLDRQAVVEQLESSFDIGGTSDHVKVEVPPAPLTMKDIREETEVGGRQTAIRMGHVIEIDPADRWALEVAVGIASQRMQQDLRETRGWAYSLGIGTRVDDSRATITASMATQPANATEAEEAMRGYLLLADLETDDDEIAAVVNRRLGRERMRRVTSIGKAYNLCADLVFDGGLDAGQRRSEGLRAVAPEDVRRVAAKYLVEAPLVTAVAR